MKLLRMGSKEDWVDSSYLSSLFLLTFAPGILCNIKSLLTFTLIIMAYRDETHFDCIHTSFLEIPKSLLAIARPSPTRSCL